MRKISKMKVWLGIDDRGVVHGPLTKNLIEDYYMSLFRSKRTASRYYSDVRRIEIRELPTRKRRKK